MTYNAIEDRNYWRTCDSARLIVAARDSGHELAIALGERLEDLDEADDRLSDCLRELRDAERTIDRLRTEISKMLAD